MWGAEMAVEQMIGSGLFVAAFEEDGGEQRVGGGDNKGRRKGPDRTSGWAESDRVWLDVAEKEELTMGCVVADEEGGGIVGVARTEDSSVGHWDGEDGKLRVQRGIGCGVVGGACRGEVGREGIVKVHGMVDVRVEGIVGERGPDAPIEHLSDIIEDAFEGHDPAAAERDGAARNREWNRSRKRSGSEN
jgi:hypothetical protein